MHSSASVPPLLRNSGCSVVLSRLPITPPEAKYQISSALMAARPRGQDQCQRTNHAQRDGEIVNVVFTGPVAIGEPTTASNDHRDGVRHHAKDEKQRICQPCAAPPRLWIGSCHAVCDQLGSDGLKLRSAAISQTAKVKRGSATPPSRRPLLNLVSVTSLSSVYSSAQDRLSSP